MHNNNLKKAIAGKNNAWLVNAAELELENRIRKIQYNEMVRLITKAHQNLKEIRNHLGMKYQRYKFNKPENMVGVFRKPKLLKPKNANMRPVVWFKDHPNRRPNFGRS